MLSPTDHARYDIPHYSRGSSPPPLGEFREHEPMTTKSTRRLSLHKLDTEDHQTNQNDTLPTETTSVDKNIRITHRVKHVDYVMLEVLIGVDFVDQSSTTTTISGNEYYSTMHSMGQQTHIYKSSLHNKQCKIEYYANQNSHAILNLAAE